MMLMNRKLRWPLLACILLLAACAGSPLHLAGVTPSRSAQMICQPETQKEIAAALGAATIAPVSPIWTADLYSCRYVYQFGTLILSVKELADSAATAAYYTG
jgi:hypothetical protein